jgi:hypothetical protein
VNGSDDSGGSDFQLLPPFLARAHALSDIQWVNRGKSTVGRPLSSLPITADHCRATSARLFDRDLCCGRLVLLEWLPRFARQVR